MIRIAKHESLEPTRLHLIANPTRATSTPQSVDVRASGGIQRPRPLPCYNDEHTPVNVGFMHIHMVCKDCDADLGDGSAPKKRPIGYREA